MRTEAYKWAVPPKKKVFVKTPYVKHYDKNGKVLNPITPANPYLHVRADVRMKRRGNAIVSYSFLSGGFILMRKVKSCKKMIDGKYPPKHGSRYV